MAPEVGFLPGAGPTAGLEEAQGNRLWPVVWVGALSQEREVVLTSFWPL